MAAVSNYDLMVNDDACHLTGHMVTAGEFVDVDTTSWARTRTRDLHDGFERFCFVFTVAFGMGLVGVTSLIFVERHLADKAVAGFAHLTRKDVAIILGEVGS